ncbi:MAG: mannose-1-phosphate guanylyltransferase/mannose-6-phosphate isomerase [bacterium]
MFSIILCGGSGTRLWPLSRKNFPKQFLNLYSDKSLLQETFLRLQLHTDARDIFFITNKENYFNVLNQIREIYPHVSKEQIVIEPASLNTAPAIAYAVSYIRTIRSNSDNVPVLVAPSDHYIGDKDTYTEAIKKAAQQVGSAIATIGITPTGPETGYGYIRKGKKENDYFHVDEFKEKPNKETARQYIDSGAYVWNSGMYLFTSKAWETELKKCAPDIYSLFVDSLDVFTQKFASLIANSIDYAISERSENIITFEGDFGWNDIGSFDSLSEIAENNNRHISIDSNNVFVYGTGRRMVATIGMEDIIIVDNNDSILVQKKGSGEKVKSIVKKLKESNHPELDHTVIVHRPWGKFENLIDTPTYKVKKILVYPGARLSLQSHNHRSEHWVVVEGTADIINGEDQITLQKEESTFIPVYTKHRLGNSGDVNLEIIEVQTGNYFGEDDIIRYDDVYERS